MNNIREKYSVFRNRNFNLLFVGQSISFTGTWMQTVAQLWLAEKITGSAFAVGVTAFLAVLPAVFFGSLGGAIADRIPARGLLFMTGSLGVVQALLFYACFASGHLSITGVYGFSLAWGCIAVVDSPARYRAYTKLVRREEYPQVFSMNNMLVGIGFMFGPAIGGYVMATKGIGWTFFLNGMSFVPMLAMLFLVRFPASLPQSGRGLLSVFPATIEGIRFCMEDRIIGPLMGLMGVAMFFGFSYRAIVPVIADDLGLNVRQFGWLAAAPGIGAILASLAVQFFFEMRSLRNFLIAGTWILALALVSFSDVHSFRSGMILFVMAGLGLDLVVVAVQTASGMITEQRDPRHMGKVMGSGAAVFFAGNAFGSLLAGAVARVTGPFVVMQWCGICLIFAGMLFGFKSKNFAMELARTGRQAQQ